MQVIQKFPGDSITSSTIIYYAETGTAATKSCSDEKPMEITITPNQNQLLILHLFAIILLLEKNQFL
jgi:lipopolysaccharide export system protein LptA